MLTMPGGARRSDNSTALRPDAGPAGHLPALDGVRGLAILLVFLHHETVLTSRTPFDQGLLTLTGLCWCGVDLFFALSGFLITGILFDARGGRGYFRNFYARRALRIFPLYYAFLFLMFFVLPRVPHAGSENWSGALGHGGWYWGYLSNFFIARNGHWTGGVLDVSWSLAIEEQFYLVWPLVVFLCGRRTLLWVCAAVVAGSAVLRCCLLGAHVNPLAVYVLTPTRLDALALGAWVALAARGEAGFLWPRQLACALAPPAAAIVLTLILTRHTDYADPWMQVAGYTALAVLAASAAVAGASAAPGSLPHRLLTCRPLRGLGKYSYALYLFHKPVGGALREAVGASGCFPTVFGSQVPGQMAFYLFAGAAACGAAWLSWRGLESPILRLKSYFPARGPVPAPHALQRTGAVCDARRKGPREVREPEPRARRPVPVPGR
jgi:peptidoglycan/LPS O-acetylase OafA/YrhL